MLYLQKQLALIGGLQGPELIFLLIVILVFFGAKKLPELAKGLGQGIKEFKKATKDVQQDLHQAMEEDTAAAAPPRKAAEPAPIPQESESKEGSEVPVPSEESTKATDASKA
jgi:sec-independent protein translocase protein TatA